MEDFRGDHLVLGQGSGGSFSLYLGKRGVYGISSVVVPTESSQDKGNFSVRSSPEENYPEWKLALLPIYRY